MKKTNNKSLGRLASIILVSILAITVISFVLTYALDPFFMLNENQLLYMFSSMAQIIGGIFGLTLTAYVFFVDKFKESAQDETYYDATLSLLRRFFQSLVAISLSCGSTILLCILGIITLHNWKSIYSVIINESVLLFALSLISILYFGIMLLDPSKMDKEIKRQMENIKPQSTANATGDFTEFLKYYNLLQDIIINLASSMVYNKEVSIFEFRQYKPQIIQSMHVLIVKEVIPGTIAKEIDNLRVYRNGLVHGIDFTILQHDCERVKSIYTVLNNAYVAYKKDPRGQEWHDAIDEIRKLAQPER